MRRHKSLHVLQNVHAFSAGYAIYFRVLCDVLFQFKSPPCHVLGTVCGFGHSHDDHRATDKLGTILVVLSAVFPDAPKREAQKRSSTVENISFPFPIYKITQLYFKCLVGEGSCILTFRVMELSQSDIKGGALENRELRAMYTQLFIKKDVRLTTTAFLYILICTMVIQKVLIIPSRIDSTKMSTSNHCFRRAQIGRLSYCPYCPRWDSSD